MPGASYKRVSLSGTAVEKIIAAAPKKFPERIALLPRILEQWISEHLEEHLSRPTPGENLAQDKHHTAVINAAQELETALGGLIGDDSYNLALRTLGWPVKSALLDITPAQIRGANRKLAALKRYVKCLATADTSMPWRKRGAPLKVAAYLIMLDIQVIYEYLAGAPAKRMVHNKDHGDAGKEYGPFWDFALAVWIGLHDSQSGLPSAIRNWAELSRRHNERSPLMENINMSRPEWGLFKAQR